ncbi:MAG: protoheme IX farnesyltransferase [Nitrospinae bacterium]|nr:protoheme IX farnesyltransferase [Nitrospinota bacterium]
MTHIKTYLSLFKLGIAALVAFSAVTTAVAMVGGISIGKLVILAVATTLSSAGAGALNHFFDRDIDRIMERTNTRPIPSGSIKNPSAVFWTGLFLVISSMIISSIALNFIVALHLFFGAFVYVVVYTLWLKRRSRWNIVIGGLSGSFAVLAGGASATPELCLPPVLIAVIMFLWTPSHFWSFAIVRKDEYKKAGVPMMPVVVGNVKTAVYVLLNTVLLVIASILPYWFGHLGVLYLTIAVISGVYFLARNIEMIYNPVKEVAWKNFKASMVYMSFILAAILMDASI